MGQGGDGKGRSGAGWAPSRGAGLKFCPIPTPPPLQEGKNLRRTKWEGAG